MADSRSGQRVRIWNDTSQADFGTDTTNPLYCSIHDGTTLLDTSVEGATAPTAGLMVHGEDGSGNAQPLSLDASGNLAVASADTKVDDSAWGVASDKGSVIFGFADEALTDSVDEGDVGAVRMTLDRKLRTKLDSEYAEDSVHTNGDVGTFMLGVRVDAGGPLAADLDYHPFLFDASGRLRVVTSGATGGTSCVDGDPFTLGTDSVSPAGYYYDDTSPGTLIEGDCGIARITNDRKQIMVLADATTDGNRLAIDANGNAHVLNYGSVDATSVNAADNPIFVQSVTATTSTGPVHDYDQGVGILKNASDNHDYTVAGTTFLLKSVIVSASGAMRAEIQVGPLAGLVTKAVVFTAGSGEAEQVFFDPPIEVPATGTGTVRVIRQNDDNQSQDLYSTIIGNDI